MLSDYEIIKALEDTLHQLKGATRVILPEKSIEEHCNILQNSLDLINRLQAKVEKCEKVERFADKTIATLQAENERLKGKVEELSGVLSDTIRIRYAEAKTEAYKECIEKIKALFPSDNEPYQYWEIHEGADNLLKELVGEVNVS